MASVTRKLVTIVTESILEKPLTEALIKMGVKGYTIVDVRGAGHRGTRSADWDHRANIRVEIVCNAELSTKVVDYLKETYYDNYGMIIYISDVEVLRSEKF